MKYCPANSLKIKSRSYADYIEQHQRDVRNEKGHKPLTHVWVVGNTATRVAEQSYLRGDWKICREWTAKAADAVVDLFFGEWRSQQPHDDGTFDANSWFESHPCLNWTDDLGRGLGWAAVGEHWELVDKLLTFPTEKVCADPEGPAARNYYVGLARWWRDASDFGGLQEAKETRGAGSKGFHLLSDVVLSIAEKNAKAVTKWLTQYVKWYVKQRAQPEHFPLNGTFLWQVARKRGLELNLAEDEDMYLFRLPG